MSEGIFSLVQLSLPPLGQKFSARSSPAKLAPKSRQLRRHIGTPASALRMGTTAADPRPSAANSFLLMNLGEVIGAAGKCGKPVALVNGERRNEAVMRITKSHEPIRLRLLVEGTLSGAWVEELEKCWLDAKQSLNGAEVRVDLSGVSYVDEPGRRLLARMYREGVQLRATGVMTKGIIEEIAANDSPNGLKKL